MKKINQISVLLLIATIIGIGTVQGQQSSYSQICTGLFALNGTNISSITVLSDDQLTTLVQALDATTTIPMNHLPRCGTFWSLQQPGLPPLPSDTIGVNVWQLGDGSFLLNDVNYDYSAPLSGDLTARPMQMSAMVSSLSGPPGFGDVSTNSYTPAGSSYTTPQYGTNLWIAQWNLNSNMATGIASNTVPEVEYEVQSITDLTQTIWSSVGFFVGSEGLNWTPLNSLSTSLTNNMLLRLRSWMSSDGSGLPDWWELQYFGTNGIDPYGDPKGDGYNNLYKFQHGMNPNTFYTPAAPQNFTASYDPITGSVFLNWLPSPGDVTGYVLQKADYQTGNTSTFNLSSSSENYTDSIAGDTPQFGGPTLWVDYSLEAEHGSNGNSDEADATLEYGPAPQASVVTDSQGRLSVIIANPPNDLSNVELYREQASEPVGFGLFSVYTYPFDGVTESVPEPLGNGSFSIPASSIINGIFQLPDSQFPPYYNYGLWIMTVRSNGLASSWTELADPVGSPQSSIPFVDARQQVKDNLRFLVRASDNAPFSFSQQGNYFQPFTWPNTNYIYSGFYGDGGFSYVGFTQFAPIEANYIFRNFVFDLSRLKSDGFLSGVYLPSPFTIQQQGISLTNPPDFYFNVASFLTNNQSIPESLLATNQTRWMLQNDSIVGSFNGETFTPGIENFYGLTDVSDEIVYETNGEQVAATYYPGNALPTGVNGVSYPQVAQPNFVDIGYYFASVSVNPLPEQSAFSIADTTPLILQGVGTSQQIAGYEFLGFNANFAYLGQYYANAFSINTNGIITTNATGILSPYGDFYATQPGQAALVTMPDIDTGLQGTCTVSCVSLQVDKNHDGTMDFTFNGPDSTSASSPMVFWLNNDHDQPPSGGLLSYPLDSDQPVNKVNLPDCSYGYITCRRGLEDFARLWVCGVPSLPPTQYAVTLSCTSLSGSPAINIYMAEPGGGIGYLTNVAVGASLEGETKLATLSPSSSYTFPVGFFDGGNKYFLFEGTNAGTAQLTLTIYGLGGVVVVQTSVYVDLHDVKDLYEQAHISNIPTDWNWPQMADSPRTSGFAVDHYVAPQYAGTTNQLILFVHGWRIPQSAYYIFSETMFKRLYWVGFQGEFAALRWPTTSSDTFSNALDFLTFNRSECIALQCGTGAAAYLNNLSKRFTNYDISVCSHSQGADVVGSALRQLSSAGQRPINNYVVMQGAFTAQSYDAAVTNDTHLVQLESIVPTPNSYLNYFVGISNAVQGRIVNFFNPVDFALGLWYDNELFFIPQTNGTSVYYSTLKPDVFWGYQTDGTSAWLTNNFPSQLMLTTPRAVTNLFELMPFVARSRCLPVGWQEGVGGSISSEVNVANEFGFTDAFYDHSGEFNHQIQDLQGYPYYTELLRVLISGQP